MKRMAGTMIDIAGANCNPKYLVPKCPANAGCFDEAEKFGSHYNKNNCYAGAVFVVVLLSFLQISINILLEKPN